MEGSSNQAILRDRTQEFLILRRAARRQQQWLGAEEGGEAAAVPGGKASPSPAETPEAPQPSWVGTLERCRELEQTIRGKLEKLHAAQTACFQHRFLSDEDEEMAQRKLVDKQSADVARLLKELDRMVSTGVKLSDTDTDEHRAALSVQKHLVTNLNVLLTSFKDGQTLYAEQIRRRDEKSKKFQRLGTAEVHERLEREERVAGYMEMGYSQVEIQELLTLDAQTQAQNKEVEEILESVKELNAMFNELHALVIEQGTVLDRIDYNLTKATKSLSTGQKQLEKAREHQKKCVIS
jgi:syntaxin 16